jgi:hypothetical protein
MKINSDKWKSIMGEMGLDNSKPNIETSDDTPDDPQLIFPSVLKISARTIGLDLVSVQPLGSNTEDELKTIKAEVLSENRNRKIDALIDNKEFEEMVINQHPDFKPGPTGQLYYMDFVYGGTESNII